MRQASITNYFNSKSGNEGSHDGREVDLVMGKFEDFMIVQFKNRATKEKTAMSLEENKTEFIAKLRDSLLNNLRLPNSWAERTFVENLMALREIYGRPICAKTVSMRFVAEDFEEQTTLYQTSYSFRGIKPETAEFSKVVLNFGWEETRLFLSYQGHWSALNFGLPLIIMMKINKDIAMDIMGAFLASARYKRLSLIMFEHSEYNIMDLLFMLIKSFLHSTRPHQMYNYVALRNSDELLEIVNVEKNLFTPLGVEADENNGELTYEFRQSERPLIYLKMVFKRKSCHVMNFYYGRIGMENGVGDSVGSEDDNFDEPE